ncbi:sugar ABC transporter ATP-binding protein [Caulobacter sp. RL271]|uniref:Sugar ABC transporter ATP-binding protein n=1 Tax=Caulobacter segnis TaxID=88688 RepID=A0ABY4ZYC1_9CAUL|nr:sugar ABC transporter ATP-binding protein [Caulobacter segnis]USQ97359.1 sugar ABC transporter ATP-binding protein [Caulobacter segnis]
MSDQPVLLSARGVAKSYGATAALRGVDFDVRGGAVNVLIGENGAGKSTLMRILVGVEQPDGGEIRLDGAPVRPRSVRDAARHGIGIVFQELNLCPNLTVVENIFLGRNLRTGLSIDHAAECRKAEEALARLGATFGCRTPVSALSIGQRQIVEIARVLVEDARVLIMDEPTSALSEEEVANLFAVIDELKRQGVGVVYISHRLEELMRIGDHITVMRDGAVVASVPVAQASVPWIIETMLGEAAAAPDRAAPRAAGEVVLSLQDIVVQRGDGARLVDEVSADFRAGEIVAIYGLLGAGRTELFEYAFGLRRGTGRVRLAGEAIEKRSAAERVERRLLMVPEDRQREGLFQNLTVGGNLGISGIGRLSRLGVVSASAEANAVRTMIARLGVKAPSGATPIGALSGGNQQKVVIGRCLLCAPLALLLDEPTRGIDIGARAEVFAAMRELAGDGLAVAFTTSDMLEALGIADRVLVLSKGRLTADLPAAQANEALLVQAANGAVVSSSSSSAPRPKRAALAQ